MRQSRIPPRNPKKNLKALILFVIIICAVAYLLFATAAGGWLADKVIAPVFNFLEKGGKQTSMNDLKETSAISPDADITLEPSSKVTESINAESRTYYLLQSGVFENEQNAADASEAVKQRGGAGYILKDGTKNRVILSAYKTESEAKNVKDTLLKNENISTYIINIKIEGLNFSITAMNGQAQALKDAFTLPEYAADTLMQLSVKYDKGGTLDSEVLELKRKCVSVRDKLNETVKKDDKNDAIIKLKDFTGKLCENIDTLPDGMQAGKADVSSKLKYGVIWIAVNYSGFMKSIS